MKSAQKQNPTTNKFWSRTKGEWLCLVAGAALTLSFAPFHLAFIAYLSPGILAYCLLRHSLKRACLRGWLFALGFTGTGASWIFVSIHTYGNANIWIAGGITAAFMAIVSLYGALLAFIYQRLWPSGGFAKMIWLFPIVWTFIEWLRSWLFTGFPWLLLAYTTPRTPMAGLLPILGDYGTGLIMVFISGLLIAALHHYRQTRKLLFGIAAVLLINIAVWPLHDIHFTHRNRQPIAVALVQGNIPQQTKWDPAENQAIMATYLKLTRPYLNNQLIIWPESAIPVLRQDATRYLEQLDELADQHRSAILLGLPTYNAENHTYYNSALVVGYGQGLYLKHHLLPFGEYLPWPKLFAPIARFFQFPMSSFTPGPLIQPLMHMDHYPVAVFICYETAFGNEIRQQLQHAEIITTISDDGWFGHSIGPAQHEQIAQVRAIETGRYILRDTNTGVTSIIAPNGKVLKRLPSFHQGVLTGHIYAEEGQTFWVRYGDFPTLLIAVLFFLCFLIF